MKHFCEYFTDETSEQVQNKLMKCDILTLVFFNVQTYVSKLK